MKTKDRILSKMYTFEELHNGAISEIPATSGVYFVLMPENYRIRIKEETDGFKLTSKGKPSAYSVEKLEKKAKHYGDKDSYSSNILYIGKAKDLHRRIEQYVGYRYNGSNLFPHDGGRCCCDSPYPAAGNSRHPPSADPAGNRGPWPRSSDGRRYSAHDPCPRRQRHGWD